MMRRSQNTLQVRALSWFAVGTAVFAGPPVRAQDAQLPMPSSFVSQLDLACHKATGAGTPARSVTLNHLNPVLQELGFGAQLAQLAELQQLCVPVAKNNQLPSADVYRYIQYTDLACYRAYTMLPTPSVTLKLSQLNPVIRRMGLPDHEVKLSSLEQVCVPVAKRGAEPPDAAVLALIQHVDVACYKVDAAQTLPSYSLYLTDLNPLFNMSGQSVVTRVPEQLCVPVAKNNVKPPSGVLGIVQWIDFEKFSVLPSTVTVPMTLTLRHLNPQYAGVPPFSISMGTLTHLDLPVAKNGRFPPSVGPALGTAQ